MVSRPAPGVYGPGQGHQAPCTQTHHEFPCSHYLGIVQPPFLERTDAQNTPRPVPFSPQPPAERAEKAEGPHTTSESEPDVNARPHPITPHDRCVIAATALLATAAQLRDSAEDPPGEHFETGRAADRIWALHPLDLVAVAEYLEARADLYGRLS